MDFLRFILFAYAFLGILIAGGLFFNKNQKITFLLGGFVLIYSLEGIDFLYQTSQLVQYYPQYFMLGFSLCLLGGPTLYLHLRQTANSSKINWKTYLLHGIPFFGYTIFTLYLMNFNGSERIAFVEDNYQQLINPLNYGKVVHVLFYAFLLLYFAYQNQRKWTWKRKQYFFALTGVYGLTAVVLTYLTAFQYSYIDFIAYFLTASTIVIIVGYMLRYKPDLLYQLKQKYANSRLSDFDKNRIAVKIKSFLENEVMITNKATNFEKCCQHIGEKKHQVSQTLSTQFNATFRDLINQARVKHAKKLLQDTTKNDLKILAIAFDSGFSNKSTFHRAFIKYAKCTPHEFRQKQVASN